MSEKIVYTSSNAETSSIFGPFDLNVRRIEDKFNVKISNHSVGADMGDAITVSGDEVGVNKAVSVIEYLKKMTIAGDTIAEQSIDYVIDMVNDGMNEDLKDLEANVICITSRGKPIKAKTVGQKNYIEAIRKNTVTFGVGPAGTGKTFLAVAMAVEALKNKQINRIVLTRPAVEAGEKLGFLPGDLQSKIDPYLRPLYDALFEMLGPENYSRHVEKNSIEIAPLAYMRGRTLDDSFIILDEAQNTTPEQMKMFLTRLGFNSKVVVTGDPTQTDLLFGKKSGLGVATRILRGIDGIAVHTFTERDVVRHRIVRQIIQAYEKYDQDKKAGDSQRKTYNLHKNN